MSKKDWRARQQGRGAEEGRLTSSRTRREAIKDAQLCRAVHETLSLSMADQLDERLAGLFVVEVAPAPDASRLCVRLEAPPELDRAWLLAALERIAPALRADIAAAVQRKRTPSLVFDVLPAYGGEGEEELADEALALDEIEEEDEA